jgi:hypothetical protein
MNEEIQEQRRKGRTESRAAERRHSLAQDVSPGSAKMQQHKSGRDDTLPGQDSSHPCWHRPVV